MVGDDVRLLEYVLGLLDKQACEEVDSALRQSIALQEELRAVEALLGELGEMPPAATASPALGERLLTSLEPQTRFSAFATRIQQLLNLDAASVQALLKAIDRYPQTPWRVGNVAGAHLLPFEAGPRLASAECALIALAPGTVFPPHRHQGYEWGFILQGQVRRLTEQGKTRFAPGDIVHNPPSSVHTFEVLGKEIMVWVLVTYGGMEWVTER